MATPPTTHVPATDSAPSTMSWMEPEEPEIFTVDSDDDDESSIQTSPFEPLAQTFPSESMEVYTIDDDDEDGDELFSDGVDTAARSFIPSTNHCYNGFLVFRLQTGVAKVVGGTSESPAALPRGSFADNPCPFLLGNVVPQPPPNYEPFNFPLAHIICLVTAYFESVEGLQTTLDSLATTEYSNSHKLVVIISDGMVKGAGNELTTPEIGLTMMKEFLVAPFPSKDANRPKLA
ncbi:chitin synthase-domain-containing protein [Mycena amicta]|nr:chitin synthase-domain-containing protein [Mycena amicta]